MKRIVTLQDISCVGRCSITVALPVISAMGVECGILPTAVLSTHTMFKTFTSKIYPTRLALLQMHGSRKILRLTRFTPGILHQPNSARKYALSSTVFMTVII